MNLSLSTHTSTSNHRNKQKKKKNNYNLSRTVPGIQKPQASFRARRNNNNKKKGPHARGQRINVAATRSTPARNEISPTALYRPTRASLPAPSPSHPLALSLSPPFFTPTKLKYPGCLRVLARLITV